MKDQDVFCVFEGGGAKGVAHVGFLSAIDSHSNYSVQGYAGTSAGAIVAALAAAGWKADELLNLDGATPQSDAVKFLKQKGYEVSSLADLFEEKDWKRIKWIKSFLNQANEADRDSENDDIGEKLRVYLNYVIIFLVAIFIVSALFAFFGNSGISLVVLFVVTVLLCGVCGLLAYFSGKYKGFASTDRPIQILESLISERVPPSTRKGVTFSDLNRHGKPLKVVAANIENGRLRLFSPETTPNVVVSQAVMASAAIPLFFKPVTIDGTQYCDGGIVSNLPAWTFDKERLSDDECLIITCEIAPAKKDDARRPDLKGVRLLTRVGATAVFGGAGLNTRGMLRHLKLENWAAFKLLDFEKLNEQIALIRSSRRYADIELDLEQRHRMSIRSVHAAIAQLCKEQGMHGVRLRVAYARPVNLVDTPPVAYFLWNCFGFDDYYDDSLVLPVENSLIGETLRETDPNPRFFDLSDPATLEKYLGRGEKAFPTKYLARDRSWVVVVPTKRRRSHSRVSVAVCVDGDVEFVGRKDKFLAKINEIISAND